MKLIIYILFFFSLQANANKYYIASGTGGGTTGNDAANGTSSSTPWATWSRLMTGLNSTITTGDSVLFNRGDSWYGAIIQQPAVGVGFGAYGTGPKPVITGLSNLTSWTNVGTNLWEAPCNSGLNLDLVLINGTITPPGRSPNAGSYYNIDSHTNLSGGSGTITSTGTNTSTQTWTSAEAVIRVNDYNLDRDIITAHSGTTITYASPNNPKSISEDNAKFFIQKHPATLDQQGEWFYYPSTHVLRMYSNVNPSTLNVQAATLNNFYYFDFRNNNGWDNLKIIGYDSNFVSARLSYRFTVTNCDISFIGADGIVYDSDSLSITRYNTFNHIGNSAYVSRFSLHGKMYVEYNDIKNCGIIKGLGLQNNQQYNGIMIETAQDSVIVRFNKVDSVGYCTLRVNSPKWLVDRNVLTHSGLMLTDAGGFYTNGENGLAANRVVSNNIIIGHIGNHDMSANSSPGGQCGIYTDDQTGNVTFYNNYIDSCGRYSIFLHNSKDMVIHDNIIIARDKVDAAVGAVHDNGVVSPIALTGLNMYNNQIFAGSGIYLFQYADYLGDYSNFGTISDNYYSKPVVTNAFKLGSTYTLNSWQSAGYDARSSFVINPADSVRGDYNGTASDKYILLTNTFSDLKATGYYRYVKVPAYSSLLLYRKTFGTIKTVRPVKIVQ